MMNTLFYGISMALLLAIGVSISNAAEPTVHIENKVGSNFDAIVSKACQERDSCFDNLQSAVDNATGGRYSIFIEAGHYQQRVVIDKSNISIRASSESTVRLYNDLVASDAKKYHRDGWGTAGSATLTINATDVHIENVHIENTFDYLSNDALDNGDPKKIRASQAVAVLLDEDSDRIVFVNSVLASYQDTLFAHGKRAMFKGGSISGNVDFIFGDGQVLFDSVEIISRVRAARFSENEPYAYIAAPSTQVSQDYGLVFVNCRLTRESGVPDNSYALGRPWHPTTNFPDGRYAAPNAIGYTAFVGCYMDKHIFAEGWTSMRGTARDGTKTDVFYPQDSRFYEQGSYGPGAAPLDKVEARRGFDVPVNLESIKQGLFKGWKPLGEKNRLPLE